jgi:DNA primase
MAPFDEVDETGNLKFAVSKYRTAKYSYRALMGWDAAMKVATDQEMRYCVLCEGPLDAARVGPGGIAVLGSSLTVSDAQRIATNFHVVVTAFDNDKAGKEATAKVTRQLMSESIPHSTLQRVEPLTIPDGKDIGEMKQEVFNALLETTMRRLKRQF